MVNTEGRERRKQHNLELLKQGKSGCRRASLQYTVEERGRPRRIVERGRFDSRDMEREKGMERDRKNERERERERECERYTGGVISGGVLVEKSESERDMDCSAHL